MRHVNNRTKVCMTSEVELYLLHFFPDSLLEHIILRCLCWLAQQFVLVVFGLCFSLIPLLFITRKQIFCFLAEHGTWVLPGLEMMSSPSLSRPYGFLFGGYDSGAPIVVPSIDTAHRCDVILSSHLHHTPACISPKRYWLLGRRTAIIASD